MTNEHLEILQLSHLVGGDELEKARQMSLRRYERLTAKGVLRNYRRALRGDVERAYEALRNAESYSQPELKPRKLSLLARRAAGLGQSTDEKPAMSNRIGEDSVLADDLKALKGRTIAYLRGKAGAGDSHKAWAEDDFCRGVLHRLEGGLLRYDSRQELLAMAAEKGIHAFRANMLMAQIGEAVRRNKVGTVDGNNDQRVGNKKLKLMMAAVAAAVVIDLLVIRYLR